MTWNEERELQRRAEIVIDSSWHFSWHWEFKETGSLTLEGWRHAKKDGLYLLGSLRRRVAAIEEVLTGIDEVVAQHEAWEEE